VVNKDGGTLVALLGKSPFQLHEKTHFSQCHWVNRDALSRFGDNEDFVESIGFLALPGKLGHCTKKAVGTLGRHDLGKFLLGSHC
jgi:hypothetical protein